MTARRVAGATPGLPLRTRLTVASLTPARTAMSARRVLTESYVPPNAVPCRKPLPQGRRNKAPALAQLLQDLTGRRSAVPVDRGARAAGEGDRPAVVPPAPAAGTGRGHAGGLAGGEVTATACADAAAGAGDAPVHRAAGGGHRDRAAAPAVHRASGDHEGARVGRWRRGRVVRGRLRHLGGRRGARSALPRSRGGRGRAAGGGRRRAGRGRSPARQRSPG